MKIVPPRFIRFTAALLALATVPISGRCETLLNEQFADGDRQTQNLPASASWFLDSSSGAYASSVSNGSWDILPPSPPSQITAVAYFTAAPVTLSPGQSVSVSFVVNPTGPNGALRFGIFNSGGARLTADSSGGTNVFTRYQGYGGTLASSGGPVALGRRSKSAKGLWSSQAYHPLSSSGESPQPAASYPVTLTVTRTTDDQIVVSSDIAGAKSTATDARGLASFDTIAVLLDGKMGQTSLENVAVTYGDDADGQSAEKDSSLVAGAASVSQAAALAALPTGPTWYLQVSQTVPNDWNTTSNWFSATSGGGTNPTSIASTDTFNVNRFRVYSPPITTGTTTFTGGALSIGPSGTLSIRGSSTTTTAVPFLISTGGVIANAGGAMQYLNIPDFSHPSGDMTLSSGASTRTLALITGTLSGAGNLTFGGGGGNHLTITNAYQFTGSLVASTGTLTFQNNVVTSGALLVKDTARVNLTKAVACTALTITGTGVTPAPGDKPGSYTYPPGTYSYATLNAAYPNIFVSGSAGGSVTVRGGTTYYLKANQALGRSWSTAYASDWNTLPSGAGTNAPAVDPIDDYSTNGKLLRSPTVTDTFTGRTLLLNNGILALKNPRPEVCTVPTLLASSGTIIQYLNTSGTATLRVNYFTQNSGTTTLYATSNQTLDLNIDYLSGNGHIRFPTAGASLFTVADASQFTGTYTQASGTLRLSPVTSGPAFAIGEPFAMKGSLVINTGAKVELNRDTYVGALSVSGSVKPNGTYTAASLGFSGTAKIVVNTPDLSAPVGLFGVNLASGTFTADGALFPTNAATWNYYQAKGLTLIRVPFQWQQVQPTLSGTLNSSIMTKMSTILSLANARGMKVIFDMHNYGIFTGTNFKIGTPAVPYTAYQDVWTKISAYFATNPNKAALFGYDIMNEPVHIGANWLIAGKYAIAGIRANDMTTYIVAEGQGWAGAQSWTSGNTNLGFIDPACRIIYSAHSYWGKNHNDGYLTYDEEKGYPNMGVDQLRQFTDWLNKRKFRGFVGEYGVPTNVASPDARWHVVLNNALNFMRTNKVSGTYWSGGYGWGTYHLLCDTGTPPVDAPPMSVVDDYHQ